MAYFWCLTLALLILEKFWDHSLCNASVSFLSPYCTHFKLLRSKCQRVLRKIVLKQLLYSYDSLSYIFWWGVFFWDRLRVRGNVYQILFYGKLGVMRVVTSQWGLTRPFSIYFSLGIVRDVVPPIISQRNSFWLVFETFVSFFHFRDFFFLL